MFSNQKYTTNLELMITNIPIILSQQFIEENFNSNLKLKNRLTYALFNTLDGVDYQIYIINDDGIVFTLEQQYNFIHKLLQQESENSNNHKGGAKKYIQVKNVGKRLVKKN